MGSNIFRRDTTGDIKWGLTVGLTIAFTLFLFIGFSWINLIAPLPERSSQGDIKSKNPTSKGHHDATAEQRLLPQSVSGAPSPDNSDTGLELVKAQQAEAARAAIQAKPVSGHVSRRPEFVSEVEWGVLRDVAAHNAEMEEQLTHLVNKLLFYKKREAWKAPTTDRARRRVLAEALLDMIPAQVDEKAIDPVVAEKLEQELRNYLDKSNK